MRDVVDRIPPRLVSIGTQPQHMVDNCLRILVSVQNVGGALLEPTGIKSRTLVYEESAPSSAVEHVNKDSRIKRRCSFTKEKHMRCIELGY